MESSRKEVSSLYEQFLHSLTADHPSSSLSTPSLALWHERRGSWERAHDIVGAEDHGLDASRCAEVHAYLHRKEGDRSNARYWYAQAGVAPFEGSLEEEWEYLVRKFIERR